jgi:hypothetical protein
MGVRGDLRLLETAVRRRYPINTTKAAETVNRFLDDADPRVALRAAAIAATMEGQNQSDEHKVIDVRITTRHDQLDAIASDLGIDISVIEAATRKAIGGTGGDEDSTNG